jgi:uncharacterized protein
MTPTYVLDACAVIAYLNAEVGADVVDAILSRSTNACVMHSVNMMEIWHLSRITQDEPTVDRLIADLHAIGVGERNDMDAPFWREVAKYRHTMRSAGQQIPLMDCFAIALANRCGVPVVTTDHGDFDYVKNNGICRVLFIRDSKTQPLGAADFLAATS